MSNYITKAVGEYCETMLATIAKKNADYAGGHPFKNFLLPEQLGLASAEVGILVRMTDKLARVSTLIDKDPAVVEESVDDTLTDLAAYALILRALRQWRKTGGA